jgi:hypothetical protein
MSGGGNIVHHHHHHHHHYYDCPCCDSPRSRAATRSSRGEYPVHPCTGLGGKGDWVFGAGYRDVEPRSEHDSDAELPPSRSFHEDLDGEGKGEGKGEDGGKGKDGSLMQGKGNGKSKVKGKGWDNVKGKGDHGLGKGAHGAAAAVTMPQMTQTASAAVTMPARARATGLGKGAHGARGRTSCSGQRTALGTTRMSLVGVRPNQTRPQLSRAPDPVSELDR